MSIFDDQLEKVRTGPGFIAALDQSGGSTPKALKAYGLSEDAWSSEDEMFDLIHRMRSRIITSPMVRHPLTRSPPLGIHRSDRAA